MKTNLPSWLLLGGCISLCVSTQVKEVFPDALGRVIWLHWGCGAFGAILFSSSLFISLRGLFGLGVQRRMFCLLTLFNLVALLGLLSLYFYLYIFFSNLRAITYREGVLPKLVENARV